MNIIYLYIEPMKTINKNPLQDAKSAYIEYQRTIRKLRQERKALLSEYRKSLETKAAVKINKKLKDA